MKAPQVDEATNEIVRLWQAVYGQPPVLIANRSTTIDVLVAGLIEPPPRMVEDGGG